MDKGQKETIRIRIISVGFTVLSLFVFKPFGLEAWQWEAYAHLLAIGALGFGTCMLVEIILKYLVRMPRSTKRGVDYIIRRNLWFQLINTPLISLIICLYRHYVLSDREPGNHLSWSNYFETLLIIAFCSFAVGLYWRFKFRNRYLRAELEETQLLNMQLQRMQQPLASVDEGKQTAESGENVTTPFETTQPPTTIVLTGTTSETVTLHTYDLLYIEAVGNYVKVCQLCDGKVHTDMLRATSKQMEDDLKDYPMIVRCHRAFLVNLGQVEKIVSKAGSMQLVMKHNHEAIPVSRSNMSQVKSAIS
ncbi:MAG: LytTR family transcriptional regulator [Bacteroidales bacterium]|nr:LytTR family transcriptional regulator [Bacteroidales bacterium]